MENNDRDQPLTGRTAIVTGASRGIGRAIALRLASAGAHAVPGARSLESPAGSFACTIHETEAEISTMGRQATSLAVDIFVNNAGTASYPQTWDYEFDEGFRQIEVHVTGPWHLCNLIVPHMIAGGGGSIHDSGSSSVAQLPQQSSARYLQYSGDDVLYASLKAAIHRFTPGFDAPGSGFTPDHIGCEVVEQMAEAALDLVSRTPEQGTGMVAWSHKHLDEIGRPTMSLDGRSVVVER